jgi:aspartate-semialdehyde dehydrogenase
VGFAGGFVPPPVILSPERSTRLDKAAGRPLVAVVGGDTLLAKELRERLGEWEPAPRVELISAGSAGISLVIEKEEESVVMTPLTAQSLEGAKAAFLAGSPASSRKALKLNPPQGPVLIDLTGALEDQPHARLRGPSAEPPGVKPDPAPVRVIAHAASIALAQLITALAKAGSLRRTIAHIFEPASERGQRGLDELHQQTIGVLNFQKLKTDVFDTQVAFSLRARYGEEAEEPLEGVEQRIERHLASLLAAWPGVPMPSLRLIQAPVFHGHSFSLWVEFENNPGAAAVSASLSAAGIDVWPDEPPSNSGAAGQSGIAAGAISVDSNHANACWLWAVADNLRLSADNAIAVGKEIL